MMLVSNYLDVHIWNTSYNPHPISDMIFKVSFSDDLGHMHWTNSDKLFHLTQYTGICSIILSSSPHPRHNYGIY